ncbi:MAG: hypothetical protein WBN03_14150 [Desulfobacterales bacterium]
MAFKPNGTVHVHHESDARAQLFQTAGFLIGFQLRINPVCLQKKENDVGPDFRVVLGQGRPNEHERESKGHASPGRYRSSPKHELKKTAQGCHRQDALNGQKIVLIPYLRPRDKVRRDLA